MREVVTVTDRHYDDHYTERRVVRLEERAWTPAQVIALLVGVTFVVLGGVALLRTGVDPSNVLDPTTSVAGLQYTPLLGMIEVFFGLLLLAVGAFPGASEGVVFLGVLALAFGLLLVIEPDAFNDSIAAGRAHGWFYVIAGGVAALTGLLTPTVLRRRRGTRAREREEVEHGRRPTFTSADHGETQRIDLTDEERERARSRH